MGRTLQLSPHTSVEVVRDGIADLFDMRQPQTTALADTPSDALGSVLPFKIRAVQEAYIKAWRQAGSLHQP